LTNWWAHSTAVIDEGVEIGVGTKIWHFCHVMSGAKIGKNCTIGQGCFIAAKAEIGDNCHIQNNVSIYDGVKIGNDVFIGPSAVFTNVKKPRAYIKGFYQDTIIKDGATIGANATIMCGVTLGERSFVGAGSVVTKNVGDHELVYGVPAKAQGNFIL